MKTLSLWIGALLLVPICAAQGQETTGTVYNYVTEGNLQSLNPVGCEPLTAVTPEHTAADLMSGVRACLEANDPSKAIRLFALANAYGHFDALRVADATARQALMALRTELSNGLSEDQLASLQEAAKTTLMQGSPQVEEVCLQLRAVGMPQYHPTYMIQHGIGAFLNDGGDDLLPDFAPAEAWEEVLRQSLSCPPGGTEGDQASR